MEAAARAAIAAMAASSGEPGVARPLDVASEDLAARFASAARALEVLRDPAEGRIAAGEGALPPWAVRHEPRAAGRVAGGAGGTAAGGDAAAGGGAATARALPALAPGPSAPARETAASLLRRIGPRSARGGHAWRLGATAALGEALARTLHMPRGYWVALTVIVVMQPDVGATLRRARERVEGTLAGAFIGGAVLALHPDRILVDTLVVIGAFGFAALRRRSYGVAVALLTVMLLMLLEGLAAGAGWSVLFLRAGANLAGGALAVGAAYWLWPRWERRQLPERLAAALRAAAAYLRQIAAALATGSGYSPEVAAARRATEVACADAAASYQRMLSEPVKQRRDVELGLALVTYEDRLARALTVTASRLHQLPHLPDLALQPFASAGAAALDDLAAAVAAIAGIVGIADPTAPLPPEPAAPTFAVPAAGAAPAGDSAAGGNPALSGLLADRAYQIWREIAAIQQALARARSDS